MIAARQELDLRPQLERLDRLVLRSEGIDPDALTFAFRPLWQIDAATAATVALTKAQVTRIYAGLGLWPAATTARLVEAQVIEDGVYPGAEAVFAEAGTNQLGSREALDAFPVRSGYDPDQPRDPDGRWTFERGSSASAPIILAGTSEEEREEEKELRATGGPIPEVQSEEPPILKPVSGMTPHGPLSTVLMPIPPKAQSAQPSSSAAASHGPIESVPVLAPPVAQPAPSAPKPALAEPTPASVTPRTLRSIEVPIGLTLHARGETVNQRANDYAEEARKALAFDPAPPKFREGESSPDGVRGDRNTDEKVALEVKYLSTSDRGLRDPSRDVSFINQKDVDQARKYLDKFKGGLLWVTNNAELADKYERLFENNRLSGFRVVFIPSKED